MYHKKILPLLLEDKDDEAVKFLCENLSCNPWEAMKVVNEFKKTEIYKEAKEKQ